jgi:trigger factor
MADALASQILERKTVDRILEYVSYQEVPLEEQEAVETLDQTASALTASEEDEAAEAEGDVDAGAASAETPAGE